MGAPRVSSMPATRLVLLLALAVCAQGISIGSCVSFVFNHCLSSLDSGTDNLANLVPCMTSNGMPLTDVLQCGQKVQDPSTFQDLLEECGGSYYELCPESTSELFTSGACYSKDDLPNAAQLGLVAGKAQLLKDCLTDKTVSEQCSFINDIRIDPSTITAPGTVAGCPASTITTGACISYYYNECADLVLESNPTTADAADKAFLSCYTKSSMPFADKIQCFSLLNNKAAVKAFLMKCGNSYKSICQMESFGVLVAGLGPYQKLPKMPTQAELAPIIAKMASAQECLIEHDSDVAQECKFVEDLTLPTDATDDPLAGEASSSTSPKESNSGVVVVALVLVLLAAGAITGVVYMIRKRQSHAVKLAQQLGQPSSPAEPVDVIVTDASGNGKYDQVPVADYPLPATGAPVTEPAKAKYSSTGVRINSFSNAAQGGHDDL